MINENYNIQNQIVQQKVTKVFLNEMLIIKLFNRIMGSILSISTYFEGFQYDYR